MKTKLHSTRNNLPEKTRFKIVALLNQSLADILDLGLQAKQAHWNVKGPNFVGLHELFDKTAGELGSFSDDVAERAVALGGTALGTIQEISKTSSLKPYSLAAVSGRDHVTAFSAALAAFGASVRKAIDTSDELGDADTADLYTGLSRALDKSLWMLEAHLQARD